MRKKRQPVDLNSLLRSPTWTMLEAPQWNKAPLDALWSINERERAWVCICSDVELDTVTSATPLRLDVC